MNGFRSSLAAGVIAAVLPLGAAERPDVMAIYFPNWHVSPQLETYYGPGKSEWDFVKTSPTRFPGHRQPLVPVHGYLDGKNPKDVAKEIDLAADAGIDVFLYDYYYYGGATILQEALDEGFLHASNRSRIKFALMWCYHEFDNEFRRQPFAPRERMYSLAKTPYEFAGMIDLCIRRYFPQPEYYRKDGALYFSIYNPNLLIKSLGADGVKRAIAEARAKIRAAGLGELHFNGQGGKIENTEMMKDLGFDSLTDYAFGACALAEYKDSAAKGVWRFDFGSIGPQLEAFWRLKENGPLPYYPLVPTGWDTSGRMRPDVQMPVAAKDIADAKTLEIVHSTPSYPYTGIYTNATAAHFERYLNAAKRLTAEHPKVDLVQINAWNEYTEGCWLVPDNFEGDAKLRAIERTFGVRATPHRLTLDLLPGEYWWGGEVGEGWHMPIGADQDYRADMRVRFGASGNNQAAPLMLSTKGRWIWCENAFAYRFEKGRLFVEADEGFAVRTGRAGESLRSAFEHCSKAFFPPAGTPQLLFFEKPILNSWMEHLQNQSQERFTEFVDSFFRNGEEPGVVMVDCFWQKGLYGDWHFNEKFPDPQKMVNDLHKRGCAVMLWISPFLDEQAPDQKKLYSAGCLIPRGKRSTMDLADPDAPGQTKSVVTGDKPPILDPSHPKARAWFRGELERLMKDYGVDGFFFDYGDCSDFQDGRPFVPFDPKATNADLTHAIQSFGETVPYQQLRAAWKQGGRPVMNTLRDKGMTWPEVRRCVADMIAAGQLGYPFIVADLVGGGLGGAFRRSGGKVDQEIYLRHLEVQALSPMVQFSLSPWRLLSVENQARLKKVLAVRRRFTPYIVEQAKSCGRTGLPMLRSMDFQFPGKGYERILDQFMLGDDLLVAPVVEGGVKTRTVVIPEGTWRSDRGETVVGPKTVTVETPLERLPYFERIGK